MGRRGHRRRKASISAWILIADGGQRLRAIGGPKPVIGVSGGLDSTHALIVCAKAFDRLGLPRSGIKGLTMPGFGTTGRTNAETARYLNRLSDLLFILARHANRSRGDILWKPGGDR